MLIKLISIYLSILTIKWFSKQYKLFRSPLPDHSNSVWALHGSWTCMVDFEFIRPDRSKINSVPSITCICFNFAIDWQYWRDRLVCTWIKDFLKCQHCLVQITSWKDLLKQDRITLDCPSVIMEISRIKINFTFFGLSWGWVSFNSVNTNSTYSTWNHSMLIRSQ